FQKTIKAVAPPIWDEICGLADALNMSMGEAVQLFGGYYQEYVPSGCSIFTDSQYLIRNYDSHPRSYEGRYVFYQPTDGGYAVVGPSMQITGRIDGINEKGLVMGYNFTHRKHSEDGFLCNMIGRLILETCADIKEAIQLLKTIPHRHSFSYALLDRTGTSYVVEASPKQVTARRSNVFTKHIHCLVKDNRNPQNESRRREPDIIDQQQPATDPSPAIQAMNDPAYNHYSFKNDAAAGTLQTAAYFP